MEMKPSDGMRRAGRGSLTEEEKGNQPRVTLPENAEMIRAGAFRDCARLETVILNAGGIAIEDDAFTNCGRLTLQVIKYSKAHDYAMENDIPFKFIGAQASDDTPETETFAYDRESDDTPELEEFVYDRDEDDTPQGRTVAFYTEPDGRGEAVTRGAGFTAYYGDDMALTMTPCRASGSTMMTSM